MDPLPLILVVEDDPQMRKFLRASLGSERYRLIEAESGALALSLATSHNPELVLLDLGLPDMDGLQVVQRLREWCQTPIVVISARGQEEDKVKALDGGADDYLTKPFGVRELLARLRVAMRHALRGEQLTGTPVLRAGGIEVDLEKRTVRVDGNEVHLTPIEYKLLVTLLSNAGKVLTHRQLLKTVWGPTHAEDTQYLRVYMVQLRHKLERDPARPRYLLTESGVGYRLRAPE